MAWLLAGLLAAASATTASASVVEALELSELVARAERVVLGRVVDKRARWDGRGRIVTDVTLRVQERMKGAPGDTITLTRLGGSIGEVGMKVAGEPSFRVGERRIVFARPGRNGGWRPVGMSQGALPVVDDAGREVVMPGGAGLSLVHQHGSQLVPAPAALLHPRPLADVLADIRDLVAHPEDGGR